MLEQKKGYSVASAKLTMYETGGGTAGETVEAHRVKEEWNKATICWNNLTFLKNKNNIGDCFENINK